MERDPRCYAMTAEGNVGERVQYVHLGEHSATASR